MAARDAKGQFADRGDLVLAVLDWVLAEQMAGRRPADQDVAKRFGLTLEEAVELHDELDELEEFG